MCRFGPQHSIRCAALLMPAFGKEREYELFPARVSQKVLIVGGGRPVMEAARVASLRGHQVIFVRD
jgi:2-enoate reductase